MKLVSFCTLLLFLSCATTKFNNSQTQAILNQTNVCPEDGICTITIEKNKSIVVLRDNFNKPYYETKDDTKKSIIHYKYSRNTDPNTQDASHIEEIIFELNNDYKNKIVFKNAELQKTKMLYGRHCYCKGQAGFFEVNQGNLVIEKKSNSVEINLDFTIKDIPQTIQSVKAIVKKD